MRTERHEFDVCVVGGGPAGVCAALAAARGGAATALINERPVLGGASSSESRMHICGADVHHRFPNRRETGILEELRLENLRRNPAKSPAIWDTILYEKARFQPGLRLFLNASCQDAETAAGRLSAITCWQLTTQRFIRIGARFFIDCSGDGILAPLSGARFRVGREARREYGESLAPARADRRTMGSTCLFHARDTGAPQLFEPPAWACSFPREEDLPFGERLHRNIEMGYWWIETGGEQDVIADAEEIRDELLKIVYGVWDHIKNHCVHRDRARNWALEWIQFLPVRRESRRYLTPRVLTQDDIMTARDFPDTVAYGGWPIDDHLPGGFHARQYKAQANHVAQAPNPYPIPLRALYSSDVPNLFCAGRCAGYSHIAFSSARVMGTCAVTGQAAGAAAALAAGRKRLPGDFDPALVGELQQQLLADDCFLPGLRLRFPAWLGRARLTASAGDPAPVCDGVNRPLDGNDHRWPCGPGDWVAWEFARRRRLCRVTVVFDSAFHRLIAMSRFQQDGQLTAPPPELVRDFSLLVSDGGGWHEHCRVRDNHQRLVRVPLGPAVKGVRLQVHRTWGGGPGGLYAFYPEA